MVHRKIAVSNGTTILASMLMVTMAAMAGGCGGRDELGRHAVRGNVTLQGQPVPSGEVTFEPDAGAGNQGPASWSEITNGRYSIGRVKGHIGGAYIIRITGYGQETVETPDGPAPAMLFDSQVQKCELPQGDATHDIDVVLPAGKRR